MPFETPKMPQQTARIEDERASLMVEKNDLVVLVREIAGMQRQILATIRERGNALATEYGLPVGIDTFLEDRNKDVEAHDEKGFQSQGERADKIATTLLQDAEFVALFREYLAKLKEEQSRSDRYEKGFSDFNRSLIEEDKEQGTKDKNSLFNTKRLRQDGNLRNVSLKFLADNDFERRVINDIQKELG